MKKTRKLILILIVILAVCIIDFVVISDKESEEIKTDNQEEMVEQVENNIEEEENFSVSFDTGEKNIEEQPVSTSTISNGDVKVITSWDFEEKVLNQKGLVVVDFYADWCQPCKKLEPVIESLASQKTNVKFYRIDTDNKNDAAINKVNETYNIMYLPTIILFKDGKEINRSIGFVDEKGLMKLFEIE